MVSAVGILRPRRRAKIAGLWSAQDRKRSGTETSVKRWPHTASAPIFSKFRNEYLCTRLVPNARDAQESDLAPKRTAPDVTGVNGDVHRRLHLRQTTHYTAKQSAPKQGYRGMRHHATTAQRGEQSQQ